MPLGEVLEDGGAVVTDRREFDPLFLESLSCVLQLDQLRFAERSPIRRAEEKKDGPVRPS